jgi:two-component system, OmpR family, sensor kinase
MGGQLVDLLTTHHGRAAELWAADPDGPQATDAPKLLDAAIRALAGGSEEALLLASFIDPETPDTDAAAHLDVVLRQLEALHRAAGHLAAEAPAETREQLHREVDGLQRRVAVCTAAMLGERSAGLREQLDAKGTALGVTVHELRRPLTILTSYAKLLGDGTLGALPPAARTAVDGMSGAADVMSHLIEALSEVARLEDADDQPVVDRFTLGELVNDAVADVITESTLRGLAIEAAGDPALELQGDRRRLCLALTNLLSNAIKHAPQDSVITIRAIRDDATIRLAVIDRGPGFPPNEAERLFEKYYRSAVERDSGIPGTGLGLFIVKTVAERHGGTVAARAGADGGAEFEMTLPLH